MCFVRIYTVAVSLAEDSVCPYYTQPRASKALAMIQDETGTSHGGSVWELKLIEKSLSRPSSLWHLPLVGFSLKREIDF